MTDQPKILITGATGLVGSYIVRNLLAEGYHNIFAGKRPNSDLRFIDDFSSRITWLDLDLLDVTSIYEAVATVDIIIHAGAFVSPSDRQRKIMYQTNVNGTANLVNAALEYGISKFIFLSSVATLGRGSLVNQLTEESEWVDSPFNTYYAITKYKAELEVWRGIAEGLKALIFNPGYILGQGNWETSSLAIFGRIANGLKYYPEGSNGLVDVRDVAQAVEKSISIDLTGERMILISENWTYQKLIIRIANHLEVPPPRSPIPTLAAWIFILFEKWKSWILKSDPMVTKESLLALQTKNFYDNSKSKKLLGMNYRKVEKTIEEISDIFVSGKNIPLPLEEDIPLAIKK